MGEVMKSAFSNIKDEKINLQDDIYDRIWHMLISAKGKFEDFCNGIQKMESIRPIDSPKIQKRIVKQLDAFSLTDIFHDGGLKLLKISFFDDSC